MGLSDDLYLGLHPNMYSRQPRKGQLKNDDSMIRPNIRGH